MYSSTNSPSCDLEPLFLVNTVVTVDASCLFHPQVLGTIVASFFANNKTGSAETNSNTVSSEPYTYMF